MAIKTARFKIKGMNQDLAVSSFSPEFAYENFNLRITATDNNTLLSLTNEKGNKEILSNAGSPKGFTLGYAVIGDNVILFTHEDRQPTSQYPNIDHIYRIYNVSPTAYDVQELYGGILNFNMSYPIETLAWYENEDIKKVYWVDGLNQPRVINIMKPSNNYNMYSFDFCRELKLQEDVNIYQGTAGRFHSGVIQYCFTYFDRYGQETNIAWESQLFYIASKNRGASPDEVVDKSFTIEIDAVDTQFEYLRLYAILRTSQNGEVSVRRVTDILVEDIDNNSPYQFTDTGDLGEAIDSTYLFYVGGSNIIAGCIASKDSTLFLGDIKLNSKHISNTVKNELAGNSIEFTNKVGANSIDSIINGYYLYNNQLGNYNGSFGVTTFKTRETYRFGMQFQYRDGQWSEVFFIEDSMNNRLPQTSITASSVDQFVKAVTTFSGSQANVLLQEGFKKVRPVVVYPSYSDRDVICQGLLCPTVFNVNDRCRGRAYAYSSWFCRPYAFESLDINSVVSRYRDKQFMHNGSWVEFRHNQPVCGRHRENNTNLHYHFCGEIQGEPGIDPLLYDNSVVSEVIDSVYGNSFNVDQQVVTMHSPDIEFDDSLVDITDDNIKLRIVGVVPIHASSGDIDIEVSNYVEEYCYTPVPDSPSDELQPIYDTKKPEGFYKEKLGVTLIGSAAWRSLVNGPYWQDRIYGLHYKEKDVLPSSNYGINKFEDIGLYKLGYIVYPWQQSGSLANDISGEHSKLQKKIISNLKFSLNTVFLSSAYTFNQLSSNKFSIGIFDENVNPMLQLDSPTHKNKKINYFGNCDKLISYPSERHIEFSGISKMRNYDTANQKFVAATLDLGQNTNVGLMQSQSTMFNSLGYFNNLTAGLYSDLNDIDVYDYPQEVFDRYKDTPISMRYKSSKHGVIVIPNTGKNTSTQSQYILPSGNGINSQATQFGGYRLCFDVPYLDEHGDYQDSIIKGIAQDQIQSNQYNVQNNPYGFLWLGELYRPNVTNKFGGTSEQAKINNVWYVAGPAVNLVQDYGFTLNWLQGDTFYQRYDHLKTYPYSQDDENQIVEIISFMCESRVNTDGRYDRLRGLEDNTIVTQELFNRINMVYSQKSSVFMQSYIPTEYLSQYIYPNTVIWSDQKINGEFVDRWTQILTTNSLDLDGDKGRLRALKEYAGTLWGFQDRAIAEILFNPNVAISTTDGSPIELASSGKVEGKRYKFNNVGCSNKWSICETPVGLFFNDDINKNLMVLGESPQNLSDKMGMSTWAKKVLDSKWDWDDEEWNNMTVQYDRKNKDVLYITSEECLAYSTLLGTFTSFYSYENTPYFINVGNSTLGVKRYVQGGYDYTGLQQQNLGTYGSFFGERQPFYTTFIVNDNPTIDKVFNTLEYRADYFHIDGSYNESKTFSRLFTWNEYQNNGSSGTLVAPNVQKKFRIWRMELPRDENNPLDRMRNPWQYIKIQQDAAWGGKVEIHDFAVHYTE